MIFGFSWDDRNQFLCYLWLGSREIRGSGSSPYAFARESRKMGSSK